MNELRSFSNKLNLQNLNMIQLFPILVGLQKCNYNETYSKTFGFIIMHDKSCATISTEGCYETLLPSARKAVSFICISQLSTV